MGQVEAVRRAFEHSSCPRSSAKCAKRTWWAVLEQCCSDLREALQLHRCIGTALPRHLEQRVPSCRALQPLQPWLVLQPTRACSVLAAKQQWFAGLVVAERCVAAVARATAATYRIAQDRKVVKLARVLPIAAVRASYVVHVIGFWTGESVSSSCSGPNFYGRGGPKHNLYLSVIYDSST